MKLNLYLYSAAFFLFCTLTACAPPHYTPEDLSALTAKTVQGVVVKQSLGSFVLTADDGTETIYRTGQLTEYIPGEYRSQTGDTVRVAFNEVFESSGRAKLAVLQLEALHVPDENKAPEGPIEGEIASFGKGSVSYMRSFYLRTEGKEEAMPIYVHGLNTYVDLTEKEKSMPASGLSSETWDEMIGKTFLVEVQRMPVSRGNGYIYVAEKIVEKPKGFPELNN